MKVVAGTVAIAVLSDDRLIVTVDVEGALSVTVANTPPLTLAVRFCVSVRLPLMFSTRASAAKPVAVAVMVDVP